MNGLDFSAAIAN